MVFKTKYSQTVTITITYNIKDNDALVSNSANITVTVIPVNDPPVATASSVTTFEAILIIQY